MNKTLRIIVGRKDNIRHLWPEILLSLALVLSASQSPTTSAGPSFAMAPFRESGHVTHRGCKSSCRSSVARLLPCQRVPLMHERVPGRRHSPILDHAALRLAIRPYRETALFIRCLHTRSLTFSRSVFFCIWPSSIHWPFFLDSPLRCFRQFWIISVCRDLALSAVTSTVTRMFIIIFVLARVHRSGGFYIDLLISGTPGMDPGQQPAVSCRHRFVIARPADHAGALCIVAVRPPLYGCFGGAVVHSGCHRYGRLASMAY